MAAHSPKCPNPDCGEPVHYWAVHCRCGHFLGFPNRRAAETERDELDKRYVHVRNDAVRRSIGPLLNKLEALAEQSRPVINMSFAACDDIIRPDKYRTYDQRVRSGERDPAESQHHSDRSKVGDVLFPVYKEHIVYAALSPDGRGLLSYGPVAVRWEVLPRYLGPRISLLEENSFTFYEKNHLGDLGATLPAGYRAIWEDRAKLAAAKLAPSLTASTAEASVAGLLVQSGATRKADEFIEIYIYDEKGLDTREVDLVTMQRAPATSEEHLRWQLVCEACGARSPAVKLIE
jgi:hypothetical protein